MRRLQEVQGGWRNSKAEVCARWTECVAPSVSLRDDGQGVKNPSSAHENTSVSAYMSGADFLPPVPGDTSAETAGKTN